MPSRFALPDDRPITQILSCQAPTQNGTCQEIVDPPSEGLMCEVCERALCPEHCTELQYTLQACPEHELQAFETLKAQLIAAGANRTITMAETIRKHAVEIAELRKLIGMTKVGLALGAKLPGMAA